MSIKSYLDYDGLSHYDTNWCKQFENMTVTDYEIDAIFGNELPSLFPAVGKLIFTTTENTEYTGIPFNLYNQDDITLTVDWGDGTNSTLISSDYASSDESCSIHSYENPGQYTVIIESNNWNNTYMSGSDQYADLDWSSLYYFKQSLYSIDSLLPPIAGIKVLRYNLDTYESISHTFKNLRYCFCGCENLTRIPKEIFFFHQKCRMFDYCFYGCSSLEEIPALLFSKNKKARSFRYCFYGCSAVNAIPQELFANCSEAVDFTGCFGECQFATIPQSLFINNAAALYFEKCFANCTNITAVPENLFSNTSGNNFKGCFYYCTSLASIPSGLFDTHADNITNMNNINFSECFYRCSRLESIPSGLFDMHVNAANFQMTFYGCSSIQSIPEGLFNKNINVSNLNSTFYGCSSIQSIPENLFINNTKIWTVRYCFNGCSALGNFTIHFTADKIYDCSYFVTKKTGTTRKIYVPSNSTTKVEFDKVKSSLGLTIV